MKSTLLAGLLVLTVSACSASTEPTAPPAAATTTLTPASSEAPAASNNPSAVAQATELTEASPEATESPTVSPASSESPISLSGKGSRKTKPFTMHAPARVDLTYSGSGNFITHIQPVGGSVIDAVGLSNTIGRTKLRTYVYELEIDGAKSYLDVLAGTGSWTIKITPGIPAPASAPATFDGKWGLRTDLLSLAGDYTVAFSHAGSGNFIVRLVPSDGSILGSESIANEIGKVKDSTEVYGLDGDYYFDVTADGAWTISIEAQS